MGFSSRDTPPPGVSSCNDPMIIRGEWGMGAAHGRRGARPRHPHVTRAVDTRRVSEATVDVADLRHHGGLEEDGTDAADAPLREDIRLLGRVLGEVVREQSGDDVLALVESTRVEAFRLRRSEV